MKQKPSFKEKLSAWFKKTVITFAVLFMALGVMLRPGVVHATGEPVIDIAAIANSIIQFVQDIITDIKDNLFHDLVAVLFDNFVTGFLTDLATQSAEWVASGGEGQKPLIFTEGWDDYLQNAAEEAVADFAITFAENVGLGNICMSPEVALDIILPQISFRQPRKARCSLDDLRSTWDVTDPQFLENFTLSFDTGQNELGIAVSFLTGLDREKEKKLEEATEERSGNFFKSVNDAISGFTETPAPVVQDHFIKDAQGNLVRYKTEFKPGSIVANTINAFVGTLAGQYLQKAKEGFFSLADLAGGGGEEAVDTIGIVQSSLTDPASTAAPGQQAAELKFSGLFKPDIKQTNDFQPLSELQICPSEVKYAGIYNCAIDTSFAQALTGSEEGFHTVRTAVNADLLHGNWSFGYSDPGTGTEPSHLNGYAYSNMKKLRRLRIIPVGWEMAAIRARQLGRRITLQEVLDEYENPGSPFYHLVDPDWVLKVPQARCGARVPAQILEAGGGNRLTECVDIQDCIVEGDNGECLSYGYCTNDRRVWRFPGDQCPEQFATCEKYFETGQQESDNLWLGSTLDYSGCNAQTAGCTWYSLVQNPAGEWLDTDVVYLNGQAQECEEEDAGCRSYIRTGRGTNLIKNSSFEDDGGHNYVLGNGDLTAGNGIPDGWSARQANVTRVEDIVVDGSYAVAISSQAGPDCNPGLQLESPVGSFEVGQPYTLSGLIRTDASSPTDLQVRFQDVSFTISEVVQGWSPFSFSFVMPSTARTYTLVLGSSGGDCADLNTANNVFYDAVQLEKGSSATIYKPYGSANEVYLKNAPSCTFEDVGCQTYVPENPNLGTQVTGIVTGADLCPAECVGYATYEQQATELESASFEDFISGTARQCSAQDVGCEQFTNLDVVAQGGEGIEYYTKLRHCETPQPQCGTYFAWEGSDTTGYQLTSFNLFAQNPDGTGAPATIDNSTTCDPNDVNCRELVGEDGSRYVRSLDLTITCSDQCVPLRAPANFVTQQECEARLGEWDANLQRCIYQAIASESRTCSAASVGCREYIGNTGKNVAVAFADNFEDGDALGWSNATISTESTAVGGHSLKLGNTVGSIDAVTDFFVPELVPGKAYTLEFAAKASVSDFLDVAVYLGDDIIDANRMGGFTTGNRNWNTYSVGPFVLPPTSSTIVPLYITVSGTSARPDEISLFLDNIIMRQIRDSVYAVKNSWNTPLSCDTDPPLPGGTAGRSMVGCQEYTIAEDPNQQKIYAKSFTRLCSEEKIGCEAVIDTFNSSVPYRQIFQEGNEAEIVIPEDRVTFAVVNEELACEEEVVGCSELGKPSFDQEGNVTGYESTYLINNPDQYGTTLCPGESLGCREFNTTSNTIVYAKHPGLQQCEYREVPNSFPIRFAWFKVGDTEENPEECIDAKENTFVQRCTNDTVSCTEFFEPITQQAFFYKKNTLRGDGSQCNGVVDWKQGCVLFDDLSIRDKYFKSGDPDIPFVPRTDPDYASDPDVDYIGPPDGCQTGDQGCDTNVLMKVNLDRECSQWLKGVSTSRFWDKNLQEFRTTSYGLGRCIEYDPINPEVCLTWDNDAEKPLLSVEQYRERDTSWSGEDYSGLSIPNLYPVETLRQRSVGTDEDGNPTNFRLTRLSNPGGSCRSTTDCPIGQVCRLDLDIASGNFVGNCYVEEGINGEGLAIPSECRGYPELDSPFPDHLAVYAPDTDEENPNQIISVDQSFANAKIAAKGEDVECSYHKVRYLGEQRYYGIETVPPSTIVVDGEELEFQRKDKFIGWDGYCLERDPSRLINGSDNEFACLTWYPVDVIQGTFDFNNSSLKAGYLVSDDRQYYCAEAIPAEWRTDWQFCARASCGPGYQTIRADSCSGHEHHRRICKPLQGDGWYAYDGSLVGFEVLGVMCQKVAKIQAADGTNSAWTTRILGQDLPGAKEYFVEDLGWGLLQQNKPYGAARAKVTKLEDLPQALIIRDVNVFVEGCEDCNIPVGNFRDQVITSNPYGTCEDEEPDKFGRSCPNIPNAGSPYALNASNVPSFLNDQDVPIRRDNKLPEDEPQPYPAGDTFETGFRRLQELFSKSYGVWEWQGVQNICVGTCVGGISDGAFCDSDAACGDPDPDVSYTCKTDTCIGGANNGLDCTTTDDCTFAPSGQIHQCVSVQSPGDPNAPAGSICESGPFVGQPCTDISDCSEDNANGVCSSERRCQGVDVNSGEVVQSVNSGKLCDSDAQCNDRGVCRVTRCSTEAPGTSSGLCSGKNAGDICGTGTGINQYVRIPVGQQAFGWDLVEDNPGLAQPPTVRPVVADPTRALGFAEGFGTAITVNGQTSGDISATGGRAPVSVSFYAYNENGEQMPLTIILVDWGDGSDPAQSRGLFKNRKHECRRFCSNAVGIACTFDEECQDDAAPDATCDPFNFGDSSDACVDDREGSTGFFSFSYTYTCEGPAPCSYTPQVLVRDNWGATTRVVYDGTITVNPGPPAEAP